MEGVIRTFTIGVSGWGIKDVKVVTRGNFSSSLFSYSADFVAIIVDLFSQFEEQSNLKITHWETLANAYDVRVIFRHEPKEKVKVAHSPETEPDIGL